MPRLTKGEIARGIAAKNAKGIESTLRIIEIFSHLLHKSQSYSPQILENFKTQVALANWSSIELGVRPQSINTLRKNIEMLYEGGLTQFEQDRKNISAPVVASSKGSKAALVEEVKDLERRKQRLVDSVIHMSMQYADLLERVATLAPQNKLAADLLRKHRRAYPEKISHLDLNGSQL
ncbi:MAG: hypothetical protein JWM78_3844 [Verrucomicrobiaceae bacterium]|nr:hypothetical protein [Verrucomicrobiaceae bacterium]